MRKSLWIMVSLVGLAVAGAMLSSIRARAASSSVVTHAFVPGVGFFNPAGNELVNVTVESTNAGYMLIYNVFDFGGGFSASGSGSIPASSVTVSGGSVNAAKVTVTLNVNTCDLAAFTTIPPGSCGTFDLNWVEMPASVGGSFATRGDTRQIFPGGAEVVTNGEMVTFFASTTGTALGFDAPPGTIGVLTEETNVTKTITLP